MPFKTLKVSFTADEIDSEGSFNENRTLEDFMNEGMDKAILVHERNEYQTLVNVINHEIDTSGYIWTVTCFCYFKEKEDAVI